MKAGARFRELRLGKPFGAHGLRLHPAERCIAGRFYVGITRDLRARLRKHNAGEVSPHTSKYGPWAIKTYIAFSGERQAFAFE